VAGLAGLALLAAGCGGGGGGHKLAGAGDCTSAAKAAAGIKSAADVPRHLGAIVRRVVDGRTFGADPKVPPADLVACVADAYRHDEEALYSAYRDALRDWAVRTSVYLADSVVGGRATTHEALRELPAEARATGRDLGFTAGALSEAGKVAGDDKEKTEEILDRLEKCPQAFLFVALRDDLTVSQQLYVNADPKGSQPKVLEGQGYEVFPKSNEECSSASAKLDGAYDDGGAGLSLVDVVLVLSGHLVERWETLYRSELLDRILPRE
jgi:hypothetical protein